MNTKSTQPKRPALCAIHSRRCNLGVVICTLIVVNSGLLQITRAQDSNTYYGISAGQNVRGFDASGFGFGAVSTPPYAPPTVDYCTAAGFESLSNFDSGYHTNNTAIGSSGWGYQDDTAIGSSPSVAVSGPYDDSVQVGYHAGGAFFATSNGYLALNTDYNNNNTAVGALVLMNIAYSCDDNTGYGVGALQFTHGPSGVSDEGANTAIGVSSLGSNTTGINNSASGWNALLNNTTGSSNFASGYLALSQNTTGNNNTALGNSALLANATGSTNIALGDTAGASLTTGSNNIEIANPGVTSESNTIRIGTRVQTVTNITGIRGTTVSGGIAVMIDANGRLGTITSSAHFKEKIKPMAKNSEAIYSLQPVTFRYKKELDPANTPQFGLVAEEVAKVDPDLVVRDEQGKPYTVRYDAVNAMLLNEFLKQERKVKDQARVNQKQLAINQELYTTLARQNAELDVLAIQIAQPSHTENF